MKKEENVAEAIALWVVEKDAVQQARKNVGYPVRDKEAEDLVADADKQM
jgi:hypothetical protein